MTGSELCHVPAPDDGDDLPADIPLVPFQGARAYAPSPLVTEPAAHVVGQADPPGAGIAPSLDVQDELVEGALGFPPGGEAALALLAPSAGEGMAADVDDVLPRAALADVTPALLTSFAISVRGVVDSKRKDVGWRISHRLSPHLAGKT